MCSGGQTHTWGLWKVMRLQHPSRKFWLKISCSCHIEWYRAHTVACVMDLASHALFFLGCGHSDLIGLGLPTEIHLTVKILPPRLSSAAEKPPGWLCLNSGPRVIARNPQRRSSMDAGAWPGLPLHAS